MNNYIIEIENIKIEVNKKSIKNVYIRIYPPDGNVKISAPKRMKLADIRVFAFSKLSWIKAKQEAFKNQERKSPQKYIDNEELYFKGNRYLLKVVAREARPKVILKDNEIKLYIRPSKITIEAKQQILNEWYRAELKKDVPKIIEKWEKIIGVKCNEFGIKRMRTKWGTCNVRSKRIWLNLELAKKTPECLEYIIVHELVHLLERKHNERFKQYMNKFIPNWRSTQKKLNT